MRKALFAAAMGIAAALLLAAPGTSQAHDKWSYGRYPGGAGSVYYGGYGGSFYGPGFTGYDPYRGGVYSPGYLGRPVIVHPTHGHWTPFRGYHEHGHIHVPHRGHYHTYRY